MLRPNATKLKKRAKDTPIENNPPESTSLESNPDAFIGFPVEEKSVVGAGAVKKYIVSPA